ncbi:MAG: response regulator transcription factor [Anaerolineaceae bacterium]
MEPTTNLIIVDDEKTIRMVLEDAFIAEGYQVQTANDAEEALVAFGQTHFDLALVDLRMPGMMNGLDLLKEIHRSYPHTIVIMLTAYASMDSAIQALREGAYDYLVKPTSISQIVAAVERGLAKHHKEMRLMGILGDLESLVLELRRELGTGVRDEDDPMARFVQTPHLTIDRQKRLVVRGDQPILLTETEFEILDYLAHNPDRVVTAQELTQSVQGYDLEDAEARPLIRVHIRRLRQKLEEDPDHPRFILNVRGKGYRFAG